MNESPPPDRPQTDLKKSKADRAKSSPTSMMGAGLELAGVVFLFSLGGWWLDSKWGTSPMMLITGVLVSMVGGVYKLWRIGKRFFD